MVLLGGNHPQAKIEVHDIVFVVGEHPLAQSEQLRQLWFGDKSRVHVDSWMVIHWVDGYKVSLLDRPQNSPVRLYFTNLGGYIPSVFGEEHRYSLVVASNAEEAKTIAKSRASNHLQNPHKDNLFDVDSCLLLDQVNGRFIHLTQGEYEDNNFCNEYTVL